MTPTFNPNLTSSVIVCGGRDYADAAKVAKVLDALRFELGPLVIHHGGATGADTLAAEHAKRRGWECHVYKANWFQFGKKAGPMRNKRMLETATPVLVVAFPGGAGTENMIKIAKAKGVPVRRIL